MNNCLNCGKPVKNKFCGTSCQNTAQKVENNNKRHGPFANFVVRCGKCNTDFEIIERFKLFPQKSIYYCSSQCAHSRIQLEDTKLKIKNALAITRPKQKDVTLTCICCHNNFLTSYKTRKRKTCSAKCTWELKRLNKIDIKKIRKARPKVDSTKITYIYFLAFPAENIRYIGKSDNPQKRLNKHIQEARYRNKNHKDHWINSLDEKPILTIIEEVPYVLWQEREIYWIDFYTKSGHKLVNGTEGGEGSNGFEGKHHTDETKTKLSIINKSRNSTSD